MFRIFFASDIHGSDVVFRKFVNAGNYYKADALIYGGDLTGKALIFITKKEEAYETDFLGVHEIAKGKDQLNRLLMKLKDRGCYYKIMDAADVASALQNPTAMQQMMMEEMFSRTKEWLELANKLFVNTDKQILMLLGNDDPSEVGELLQKHETENLINVNEKRFTLNHGIEGFGLPFSNMTPWNLPGDISEEKLASKIDALASSLSDVKSSIFLIHVPPANTTIDEAPLLEDLKVQVEVTGVQTTHVGSVSVRAAIEKYQPMVALHGHIHESRGVARIGKTLCVNAGSEYEQGVLRGAIINIDEKTKKLKSHLLVSG